MTTYCLAVAVLGSTGRGLPSADAIVGDGNVIRTASRKRS